MNKSHFSRQTDPAFATGFYIKFENNFGISVQWSRHHRCDNLPDDGEGNAKAATAEVWISAPCDVQSVVPEADDWGIVSNVSPDALVKLMERISSLPRGHGNYKHLEQTADSMQADSYLAEAHILRAWIDSLEGSEVERLEKICPTDLHEVIMDLHDGCCNDNTRDNCHIINRRLKKFAKDSLSYS